MRDDALADGYRWRSFRGMSRAVMKLASVCVLLGTAACTTVQVREAEPLRFPPTLTRDQVREAVFAVLSVPPEPEKTLSGGSAVADKALRATLWPFYRGARFPAPGSWYAESVNGYEVTAIHEREKRSLRIRIVVGEDRLVHFTVLDASELKYNGKRIHKAAYVWIGELENQIRREMGKTAIETAR